MRKIVLSILLTLVSCLTALSQTYDEWCERAVAATEQDSLELAEKCIRQALKLEPANPRNALLFSIWVPFNVASVAMSRLWSLIDWL